MDLNLPENVTITNAVETANTHLGAASLVELLCVVAVPLLALLMGIKLNRFIDTLPKKSLSMRVVDFVAPLLASVFAFCMLMGLHYLFQEQGVPIFILPFAIKLALAWFAIQLAILMSSRQSAGWVIAFVIIPITLLHLFNLWDVAIDMLSGIEFTIGNTKLNLYVILKGILVICALQWLASFAVRVMDNRLSRVRNMRASNRTLIVKIFQILLYFFVFVMGMQFLGISLAALSVFGGALGVGLGFGLQKIASNFVSGIILLFEKSIEIGDLIELTDGTTGFVRRTHARYTLLEVPDGRELLIPNDDFISQRVFSWTHSNKAARGEIVVTVTYDSDVELARKIMLDAANEHPKRHKSRASMCTVDGFTERGVQIKLNFWVADVTDGRMEPRSDIMRTILLGFKANHITIPINPQNIGCVDVTPPTTPAPKLPEGKKA